MRPGERDSTTFSSASRAPGHLDDFFVLSCSPHLDFQLLLFVMYLHICIVPLDNHNYLRILNRLISTNWVYFYTFNASAISRRIDLCRRKLFFWNAGNCLCSDVTCIFQNITTTSKQQTRAKLLRIEWNKRAELSFWHYLSHDMMQTFVRTVKT